MKGLKKRFRIKKKIPGGDKLRHSISLILPKLIKIKPKLGRWCSCIEGRLPYPIECTTNKSSPVAGYFKKGKHTVTKNNGECVNCKRFPEWHSWKKGDWNKIKEAIKQGEDLRDMDPPNQEGK